MIRFIYFDAGGTLVAPHPSVGTVYARAARAHGLELSPEEMQQRFRVAWKKHVRPDSRHMMGTDETSAREWWRVLVEEVFDACAYSGDRAACFGAMFDAFSDPAVWRIYDDVAPALTALAARGVRLGVLSNWDYRLRALLSDLDLSRWFDPLIISAEVGCSKPDPRIFQLAIERTGLTAGEIAYIGDHPEFDLHPAQRAGISAYLISRTGSPGPNTLTSLTQLSALLT